MHYHKKAYLVPMFHFAVTVAVIGLWLNAYLHVVSMNELSTSEDMPQARVVHWTGPIRFYAFWMIVSIVWVCLFFEHACSYVMIVMTSEFYFTSDELTWGETTVSLGFLYAYIYNLGSLAFGSAILTWVRILRFFVEPLAEAAQKAGEGNACANCLASCGGCFLGCVEQLGANMTEAAYVYMAVTGQGFTTSAQKAFWL